MPKIIAFEMVKETAKNRRDREMNEDRLISIVATLQVICVYVCGY